MFGSSKVVDFPRLDLLDAIEIRSQSIDWCFKAPRDQGALVVSGKVDESAFRVTVEGRRIIITVEGDDAVDVECSLPANFKGDLIVQAGTGNVVVEAGQNLQNLSVTCSEGDMELKSWPREKLVLNSEVGSIHTNVSSSEVATKNIDINVHSSIVELDLRNGFSNLNIKTGAGSRTVLTIPRGFGFRSNIVTQGDIDAELEKYSNTGSAELKFVSSTGDIEIAS